MRAEHLVIHEAMILKSPEYEVKHQIKSLYNLLPVKIQSKTTKPIPQKRIPSN